jgi:hypothetical protein
MTHALKTDPEYFQAILDGKKTFEVRKKDRPFKTGERLLLQEFDRSEGEYSGRETERWIIYILEGGRFGIDEGYVVMGLKEIEF